MTAGRPNVHRGVPRHAGRTVEPAPLTARLNPIPITPQMDAHLRGVCAAWGISRAEVVRLAIRHLINDDKESTS